MMVPAHEIHFLRAGVKYPPALRTWPTIADRFDERSNGITLLRLALAVSVVVFHAWPLGGFGPDPAEWLSGGQVGGGGTLSVLAFFTLSGLLLGRSRARTGPVVFAWRRALRILPGYWVCMLATSAFVGLNYFGATWLIRDGIGVVTSPAITGPWKDINGSIWTLWPEVVCYAILAVTPIRFVRIVAPVIVVATLADFFILPKIEYLLAASFFLGVIARHHAARIPLHGAIAGALGAGWIVATFVGLCNVVAPIVLGYAAIWAAVKIPVRWSTDISYGVYIYAFPIAQGLVALGFHQAGLLPFMAVCITATVPVATVSWLLIERPALRLKSLRPGSGPVGAWLARSFSRA
jgi:peptidoglycan/LPS O-acetylase OafA/YrhL